jgi:hypothetical protein
LKSDGSFSGFTSHPVEISAFFNAYNFTTTKHNKLFKEEHRSIAVYAAYIFAQNPRRVENFAMILILLLML